MQPLFVIFFTCFHQPFPFQKTNSSLSAYFSTIKELWFFTLYFCHFFRGLSEKQVNSNSCHRDCYDRSFKEAYQQFPELDRRLHIPRNICHGSSCIQQAAEHDGLRRMRTVPRRMPDWSDQHQYQYGSGMGSTG